VGHISGSCRQVNILDCHKADNDETFFEVHFQVNLSFSALMLTVQQERNLALKSTATTMPKVHFWDRTNPE